MLAGQVVVCQRLSHRTIVDSLNRPNLQEVRTVQGAKVLDQLLQAQQPGQQMQPLLLRSLELKRRTISLVSRQRVASMTTRTTAVSTGGQSPAGTTVQQAEMPIRRASHGCAVVIRSANGGNLRIDRQGTCIRGVYLLLGKVLGLTVDTDGISTGSKILPCCI